MSVIQNIRDKYARIAVIAIALALTGFILMDAFTGKSRLFSGGNSTTLGVVNGKTIDEKEFEKKVQIQEQSQEAQKGSVGEAERQQIIESLWNQEVNQILLTDQFNKLGLTVGAKELTDMLYGPQPHQLARQYLGDPQTGEYDPNRAMQIISQIKRGKDKNQKEQLNILLTAMETARLTEKYTNLVAGSVHYPKWFLEKQNAENSLIAKISYVTIHSTVIPDSAKEIAVSDKEIADYIDKHADLYKMEDETRTIEYVKFSAAPSAADSAAVREKILSLKTAFDTTRDMPSFIKANSELLYYDSYIGKKNIQLPNKDSILKTPVGKIYGPYVDKDNYVLAKIMGVKQWSDTVKVRHILIATRQQTQDGQMAQIREDSTAKKLADSIQLAIKNGAKFDSLCAQYSDDPGSKDKGGVYDNVASGRMVSAFNDFIFDHKTGEKGIVKTEFGYHYIEILSQKGSDLAYKIAYLAKRIETSEETDRKAQNAALQFAGQSRDLKSFEENFDKNLKGPNMQRLFASDIGSHAYDIPGVGQSRKFVKQIFDANKGEVLQPERVDDSYVVAIVTEINKPGKLSVAAARKYIEPPLKNKKKAAEIKKKLGVITTLEAAAATANQLFHPRDTIRIQMVDSVHFAARDNNPIAYETKLIGAAFNPENKGKIVKEAIDGNYGDVYVVRVDNISSTPVGNADVNVQKKNMEAQGRQSILVSSQFGGYNQRQYDPAEVLRKAATIKDSRNKFY